MTNRKIEYWVIPPTANALFGKDLRPDCPMTLLANRGFDHGEFIHWLIQQEWHWAIRAKCDLNIGRSLRKGLLHPWHWFQNHIALS